MRGCVRDWDVCEELGRVRVGWCYRGVRGLSCTVVGWCYRGVRGLGLPRRITVSVRKLSARVRPFQWRG